MKTLLLLFLILLTFSAIQGQNQTEQETLRTYTTTKINNRPIIDGKLDDACWQNNNWSGNYTQLIPNEGAKPTFPTYLNIVYDNKNIYVAIRAVDYEPDKIVKKAGRRDQFVGDMVGINFDSYNDNRTGFEFNMSAAGQQVDLLVSNPMEWDINWDAVWNAKVGFEDSAWVVEYEIPLSQLRYSNENEQTWGLHAWRWFDRYQEESDWEPLTLTGPGILYQFGDLKGIKNLPKSRRLELMPYALGRVTSIDKDVNNPFAQHALKPQGVIGLDAKIGISSNFTADVTINPDFGQVESDPSEMNLTAFETFHEEKRPFFLEGRNIFNFEFDGDHLFYSRRIGNKPSYNPSLNENEYIQTPQNTSILGAAKISGKTSKGLSVGILQSITNQENAIIKDQNNTRKEIVEPLTNYTLARLQQDYNEGNTVLGGIITSTNRFIKTYEQFESMSHHAFTGGLDFLHQWNEKEFYLDAKFIFTSVSGNKEAIQRLQNSTAHFYQRIDATHLNYDPELTVLNGHGGNVKIGKGSKGNWRYSTAISWRSPGLEMNDIGFMQMADLIINRNELSYFTSESVGIFRKINVSAQQNNVWDYALNHQQTHFNGALVLQFLNKWTFNTHMCHFPDAVDSRILRGGAAMKVPSKTHGSINISSDASKKAILNLYGYYEQGATNSSQNIKLNAFLTYQPLSVLKLSASTFYSYNENALQYVGNVFDDINENILGNIQQQTAGAVIRVNYMISPKLSIEYYGSPFISAGKFTDLKLVTTPFADKLQNRYQIIGKETDDLNTLANNRGIDKLDFTFTQYRSNLVFRWEYQPGSRLYLVWANERTNSSNTATGINKGFSGFRNSFPSNIFLIKLNYWFSL